MKCADWIIGMFIFSMMFIAVPEMAAQTEEAKLPVIVEILLPFIDKYFTDMVVMMGAMTAATQAVILLIDKNTNFVWNKISKIIMHGVTWQVFILAGINFDIGILADLSYVEALQLTFQPWLGASGVYTIVTTMFGAIGVGDYVLKTKNKENK